MFIDARSMPSETAIETELCIVGAGAAGISLARECAGAGFRVALLESGGMEREPETQQLYAGRETGLSYLDLTTCRLRYFGGTTNHWGGWVQPFDEADLEERDGFPYSGWPFDRSHLDPWYRRAHEVCQLGPYEYRPDQWHIATDRIPAPFRGPHLISKISQIGPTRFGAAYEAELRQAPRLTVYLHANALGFDTNDSGSEVRQLRVATLSGNRLSLRARIYVLAAGGIENPRLLLLSGQSGNGIGNEHDLVGRFFTVHLAYSGGAIVPSDPYVDVDFATMFQEARPWPYFSFIGLSDDAIRTQKLANFRILPEYKLTDLVRAVDALKRLASADDPDGRWTDLRTVVRDIDGLAEQSVRKGVLGQSMPIEAMILHCSSEQLPNPDSRVTLDTERDALGLQKVVLDWRLTREDKRQVNAVHRLLASEIGRVGFGRLRYMLSEDDTTWPADLRGAEHHMGTTRMHRDPTKGVVDETCRVHSLANLYVTGSSVFPTGGACNPTLSIVALALRLADHIKERLA